MFIFRHTRQKAALGRALLATGATPLILILCLGLTASAAQQTQQTKYFPTNEKRLGAFNAMVERREIRALVVYSKTFYFLDKGRRRIKL